MSGNVHPDKFPPPMLEALVKCVRLVFLGACPLDLQLRFRFSAKPVIRSNCSEGLLSAPTCESEFCDAYAQCRHVEAIAERVIHVRD